ncbi:MAG: peptidylprolyl isomerase [Thermodesulfobacteriota bacterium]
MYSKHLTLRLMSILLIPLWAFAAMALPRPAPASETVDRIVAIVNDDIISLFELNKVYRPYEERIKSIGYPPQKEEEMLYKVREDLIDQLIEQKLTDQQTEQAQITVSEAEIDNAIERIKQANYYSDEQMLEGLKREGFTMSEYRDRLREQILRTKLVNREVKSKIVLTEEDIRDYYQNNPEEFQGEQKYHLRNILLRVSPYADDEEKAEIQDRLEAIRAQVEAGKSFAEMARQHSEISLAEEGGDLGFFTFESLAPHLKSALEGLAAGDMTPVLDTEQGMQLFYVEEIQRETGKDLKEAMAEIEEKLYNEIVDERFKSWLSELRENSHIKIIR